MEGQRYTVAVVIENKPLARDPEGEAILRELILKGGYSAIKSVRTAKLLRLSVEAASAKEALSLVEKLCNELRLYNPAAHRCTVKLELEG